MFFHPIYESLKKHFIDNTIKILIYSWCRTVNRILAGTVQYDGDDETKSRAQEYYNRYKQYKTKK